MKFAALILDFDGLILDTESPIFEEWRATFRARGHDLGLDVWQHALGTFGTYDPCAHLSKLTGEAFDHEALRQEVRARNMVRCEALPLLPGVADRVQEARASGLKTAVASSSTSAWVEGWLERHGIRAARAAGMRCVAIPNAVTCALPMEGADLVLPSLSAQSLPQILGALGRPA